MVLPAVFALVEHWIEEWGDPRTDLGLHPLGIRRTTGNQESAARWLQHGRAHLGNDQDG